MRHLSLNKYVVVLVLIFVGCGTTKRSTSSKHEGPYKEATVKKPVSKKEEKQVEAVFTVPDIKSTEHYVETFSHIAQDEMRLYGIPASITLAQGILESGSGKGELTQKTNNHFGIKCHKGWEGDRDYHDDDAKGECFRKYLHPVHSFRDHSKFLTSRARYASLFELRRDNYKGWARGLKKAGYATDPRYPQKLVSIIEKYELYKYDREVMREGKLAIKAEPKKTEWVNYVVQPGDTLYGISMKYKIPVEDIKSHNGISGSTINVGQILMLKKPITSK